MASWKRVIPHLRNGTNSEMPKIIAGMNIPI